MDGVISEIIMNSPELKKKIEKTVSEVIDSMDLELQIKAGIQESIDAAFETDEVFDILTSWVKKTISTKLKSIE